jgi:hypothetical protein
VLAYEDGVVVSVTEGTEYDSLDPAFLIVLDGALVVSSNLDGHVYVDDGTGAGFTLLTGAAPVEPYAWPMIAFHGAVAMNGYNSSGFACLGVVDMSGTVVFPLDATENCALNPFGFATSGGALFFFASCCRRID